MKNKIRRAAAVIDAVVLALFASAAAIECRLPDSYSVVAGEQISFDYPITVEYTDEDSAAAVAGATTRTAQLRLFGAIQLKTVEISTVERKTVFVSGEPFGIKMFTDGLMVVGMSDVPGSGGRTNPAKAAGLRVGDIIERVGGERLTSNEHLGTLVKASDGNSITMTVRRGDEVLSLEMAPLLSTSDGQYHIGVWVRDSSAGIGTMTFYDPNSGLFTGLGHAICDIDTGDLMPLYNGEIVAAEITGCKKGESGSPGELKGCFIEGSTMGTLITNSDTGVYGMLSERYSHSGKEMPVASVNEVHTGPATIYTTLDGMTPQEYGIYIEKTLAADNPRGQNMIIRVTDQELLEKTGGIVQGMSGSPIMQDGRLVGSVTHVFVKDPTRGYGIYIQNVMNNAAQLIDSMRISLLL